MSGMGKKERREANRESEQYHQDDWEKGQGRLGGWLLMEKVGKTRVSFLEVMGLWPF